MHIAGNLVIFLTVEFSLNWSIIDEVTTRSTMPGRLLFSPSCSAIWTWLHLQQFMLTLTFELSLSQLSQSMPVYDNVYGTV